VKKRRNWHRHDYTEPDDGSKPVQAGTSVFVRELQARTFPRYVCQLWDAITVTTKHSSAWCHP